MTLCIAASCFDDKDRPRIVVSSDWLAELGTLAATEAQNKLYWLFRGRWCVLISGTVPAALDLLNTIERSIDSKKLKRTNIQDELTNAVLKHRKKLANRYVKSQHSVSLKYFRSHKDEFTKGQWEETQAAIKDLTLECSILVCTFIKRTPLIFQVNEDCSVVEEENFAAIGSGSDVTHAVLCYRRQSNELSVEESAYNIFEGTKFARKAKVPGVGKLHAFSVLSPRRKQRRLRQQGVALLEKYFEIYGPRKIKTLILSKKVWQRY